MPLETINMARPKGEKRSDFHATPEELRSIQERMKDPKFVELMSEYMQSLSDPETRAEEEAYLEQAEREARDGGDFTFDFIFPRPMFVCELAKPTTTTVSEQEMVKLTGGAAAGARSRSGVRSFINFCVSDKVEVYTENPTGDARGSQWHVPVSVCAKRLEYYYENKIKPKMKSNASAAAEREAYAEVQSAAAQFAQAPEGTTPFCYVYDAVYHPQTLSLADRSNRFLCFLVEIAVEHINAGYKESNGFEFSRLSSSIVCIGYPKNQTIRKKGSENPFAVDPVAPVLTKPTKHMDGDGRQNKISSAAAKTKKNSTTPPSSSSKGENSETTRQGITLPPVTIKHRGSVDFADAWEDQRVYDKKVGVPEVLVVSLDFKAPSSSSAKEKVKASAIDIAVVPDGTGLQLNKTAGQPYFEGFLVLPFSVEEDPRSAKFDVAKRVLTLELTVKAHHLKDLTRANQLAKEREEAKARAAEQQEELEREQVARKQAEKEALAPLPPPPPPPPAETTAATSAVTEDIVLHKEKASTTTVRSSSTSSSAALNLTSTPEPLPPPPAGEEQTGRVEEVVKVRHQDPEAAPSASSSPSAAAALAATTSLLQDQDRVQAMLAKVQEARQAREKAMAAAAAAGEEEEEGSEERKERPQGRRDAGATVAPPSATPEQTKEKEDEKGIVFIQKKDPVRNSGGAAASGIPDDLLSVGRGEQEAMLKELEARQSAWVNAVEAEDAKEVEAAARRARRDAEKAKQRYEAALAQEKLEERALAQRRAAPLKNMHVFAID
eukprot:gene13490-9297_t